MSDTKGIGGPRGVKPGTYAAVLEPLRLPYGVPSAREKKKWKQVVADVPDGFWTAVDQGNMRMYVTTWCQWEDAIALVKKQGHLAYDDKGNSRRTPASMLEEALSKRLVVLAVKLSMCQTTQNRLRNVTKLDARPEPSDLLVLDGDRKVAGGRR